MVPFEKLISQKLGLDLARKDQKSLFQQVLDGEQKKKNLSSSQLTLYYTQNPLELQSFLELLTVGETYFFRHLFQFEALQEYIPNIWSAQKTSNLRIWSAATSTGEEAYSLAIFFKNLFCSSTVSVLGTDINRNSIKKAKIALYNAHSFRKETPSHMKDFYFDQNGEKFWKVKDHIRERVEFNTLNLIEEPFWGKFDCIFLRNVMMYWNEKSRERVLKKIQHVLHPTGILVVAPCEFPNALETYFRKVCFKNAYFYVPKIASLQFPRLPSFPEKLSKKPLKTSSFSQKKVKKKLLSTQKQVSPTKTTKNALQSIRTLANEGRYMEVIEEIEKKEQMFSEESEIHYLLGLSYENLRMYQEAIKAYEKVQKLQPEFISVYIQKGEVYMILEKREEAEKNYKMAYQLLKKLDKTAIVPLSGGLTSGILLELVQSHLKTSRKGIL